MHHYDNRETNLYMHHFGSLVILSVHRTANKLPLMSRFASLLMNSHTYEVRKALCSAHCFISNGSTYPEKLNVKLKTVCVFLPS